MLQLVPRKHFLLGLVSLLFFTLLSCTKKEDATPDDISGSFDATFSPATSISFVAVSAQGNSNQVASGQPDATGYMKVANLSPGTYVVTYNATSGYAAPAAQTVTITAKGNTALGTIKVNQTAPPNTNVSYALQGTSGWTSTLLTSGGGTTATQASTMGSVVYYNNSPSSLTLKGIYQSGSITETVQVTVPYYAGVGQYQLGNLTGGGLGTYLRTSGSATTHSLSSQVGGIQGTLSVTTHNTSSRTISGTFGFNLFANTTASGTITNGTFTVTY